MSRQPNIFEVRADARLAEDVASTDEFGTETRGELHAIPRTRVSNSSPRSAVMSVENSLQLPLAMSPLEDSFRRIVREELEAYRAALRAASPSNPDDEWCDMADAMDIAKVRSPTTIRKWEKQGLIKKYGGGGVVRYKRSELEAVVGREHTGCRRGKVTPLRAADAKADEILKKLSK